MASLDSVRGKVESAYQHLQAIVSEIRGQSYKEVGKATLGEVEIDGRRAVSVGMEEGSISPALPYLIGDCLQNLRTSLDYLVWELVLSAGNVPNEKNQFPICDTQDAFKGQFRRHRLDGIPQLGFAEIESLQPYQCGKGAMSNSLLILEKLCNINKHRRLILTRGTPVGLIAQAMSEDGSAVPAFFPVGDHATNIGLPRVSGKQVKMEGISVHCVTFEESAVRGEQVNQVLGRIGAEIVSNVLPRFEKFFK